MLNPVIAVLRRAGIPFHNPYRKSNGFWNPLRHGRKGTSADRVLSLLGTQLWTHGDLRLWTEWLSPKGNLRTGAKALLETSDDALPVTPERLNELFEPAASESLLAAGNDSTRLLHWWSRRVAPAFEARVQFPVAVARIGGRSALEESPRVTVGTIHSVKGGEADVVFLFPDLSRAGDAAYQRFGPDRDAVIRLLYVGMTRARHTLYLCQGESAMTVAV
jgi:DNA helicase-2/ATP-dependent DNA helicase PcrA